MYRRYSQHRTSVGHETKMAEVKDAWTMDVPREWMVKLPGFAMDTGGSVMKLVYRHKDDWEELKDSDKGRLRCILFSRAERDVALDYLKERCHYEGDENTIVFQTGMGSAQFAGATKERFNAQLENISEFDCFVKAFMSLTQHFSQDQLCFPPCVAEENRIKQYIKAMDAMYAQMGDQSSVELHTKKFDVPEAKLEEEELFKPADIFPCILAMCGSGFGFIMVQADGSMSIVDGLFRGGRTFMGLGSLLTDAKTYAELSDLAEKGNPMNVHYNMTDVALETLDPSEKQAAAAGVYENFSDNKDSYLYIFGKAVGKSTGDFRREDLAACLLQTTCSDVVQLLDCVCRARGIKSIFWAGGFVDAPVVRSYLTLESRRRSHAVSLCTGEQPWLPMYFLKHGPYLGALGCVLNSVQQFLKPPSQLAAERAAKQEAEKAPSVEK